MRKFLKRLFFTRVLFFRSPLPWFAAVLGVIQLFVNILIPTYFRIMIDFVIPAHSVRGFAECIVGALLSVVCFSLLRAMVKYLTAMYRDLAEAHLSKKRIQLQIEALEQCSFGRFRALNRIPQDSFYRIAELSSILPNQIIAGSSCLFLLFLVLYRACGASSLYIGAFIVGLKIMDLWLSSKQAPRIKKYAEAKGEIRTLEQELQSSHKTVFGLFPKHIVEHQATQRFARMNEMIAGLRTQQLYQDFFLFISSEALFLLSFLVAGIGAFNGSITFGQFVFVITLLLQLQLPVSMLIEGLTESYRMRRIIHQVSYRLHAKNTIPSHSFLNDANRDVPVPKDHFRIAISGPSGIGKSTLAISWYRQLKATGKKVALVPQNLHLFPEGVQDYCDKKKFKDLIGLEEIFLGFKDASKLSGGEARRLLILRAMQLEPDVIILDEPESGLDDKNKILTTSFIKRHLTENPRLSWVIISHDQDFLTLLDTKIDLSQSLANNTERQVNYG